MATAKKDDEITIDEPVNEPVDETREGTEDEVVVAEAPVKKAAAKKVAPAPVTVPAGSGVEEGASTFSWVLDGTRYVSTVVPEGIVSRSTRNPVEVAIAQRGGVWARPDADVDAPFREA